MTLNAANVNIVKSCLCTRSLWKINHVRRLKKKHIVECRLRNRFDCGYGKCSECDHCNQLQVIDTNIKTVGPEVQSPVPSDEEQDSPVLSDQEEEQSPVDSDQEEEQSRASDQEEEQSPVLVIRRKNNHELVMRNKSQL